MSTRDEINEKLATAQRWAARNFWRHGRYVKLPWDAQHEARMQWWREARFGMIIHFGLYSLLGRHEWVMNSECMSAAEYEPLADRWHPRPGCVEEWVRLAAGTGMRYAVLTTKHHEGFCLWDTAQTDFNAVTRGPQRDLVREFVEACRRYDLKIGLYYSLMDWHHPDGLLCKTDEEARERFLTFTHGCVEELLSRYGTIDILWYDVPSPLSPEEWRAEELNTRARELQPGIIINDRTGLPGDFATPEEGVIAAEPGRDWEVAMTMNLSWGYSPGAEQDWRSVREIIRILYSACAHSGNFLLNLGPEPDGSIPEECRWRFETVGRWVAQNRETVHGQLLRVEEIPMHAVRTGSWVAKDETTQFFWCHWWQPGELVLGGVTTPLKKVTLLATGEDVTFEQQAKRTVLKGLPEKDPSPETGFNVFKLEFVARPQKTSRTAVEWW